MVIWPHLDTGLHNILTVQTRQANDINLLLIYTQPPPDSPHTHMYVLFAEVPYSIAEVQWLNLLPFVISNLYFDIMCHTCKSSLTVCVYDSLSWISSISQQLSSIMSQNVYGAHPRVFIPLRLCSAIPWNLCPKISCNLIMAIDELHSTNSLSYAHAFMLVHGSITFQLIRRPVGIRVSIDWESIVSARRPNWMKQVKSHMHMCTQSCQGWVPQWFWCCTVGVIVQALGAWVTLNLGWVKWRWTFRTFM